ncbi:MAG: flavodoxin family protein [Bacteroidetes bacterium]|nr:flavodoxin family protein [Bacteroidota bacterium]MCL5025649.1 flavodoxin family protein [Chloroflexota bacterium]
MKVVAVIGSPRVNGNTEALARHALEAVAAEGIDTEIIRLAGLEVAPCDACMVCRGTAQCSIQDEFQGVYDKMLAADGIILASPVYFGSATANIKAVMDRAGYVARNNGDLFARKVGGPLVVARRAGQNFTYAQLMYWFMICGFVVPGSTYWNIAFGRHPGDVAGDEEGMRTVANFGKNIAWLLKSLGDRAG